MKKLLGGACVLAALAVATPASALTIILNNTGGVTPGTQAYQGFRAAANFWESMLTNDATVVLNVGFTSTGFSSPNIIGQTGSTRFTGVTVSDVLGQFAATGNSQIDAMALASFNTSQVVPTVFRDAQGNVINSVALSAITQKPRNAANNQGVLQNTKVNGVETVSNREWDNDGSRNNYDLAVNSSVLKALGYDLTGAYNGIDASITFNSAFNFDFDARDGIGVGQTDFLGTAIHEIGHALGFVSGVDRYDTASATSTTNYDAGAQMSTLDLFRYSDDVTGVAPGTGAVLDWSVGNAVGPNGENGRPYFSFDGGQSKGLTSYGGNAGFFSTGATNGDGNQASHWQDTPYTIAPGDQGAGNARCLRPSIPSRGIMDPTFAPCEQGIITSLDMAAFDALGWNISYDVLANINRIYTSADIYAAQAPVPEPATWAMLTVGFMGVGGALRRSRRSKGAVAIA